MKKLLIYMIISVMGLFFCVMTSMAYAQTQALAGKERSARIDISSENMKFDFIGVNSNGSVNFAEWLSNKEDWKKAAIAQMILVKEPKSDKDKWQELWIEFTPTGSGFVLIFMRGSYYPDLKVNHHEVWVDDVKVTGDDAVLDNGSFEEVDNQGNPAGWGWPEPPNDRYNTDGTQARTGKSCVLVWHDGSLIQKIAVKAGQKYRVSAWFKPY